MPVRMRGPMVRLADDLTKRGLVFGGVSVEFIPMQHVMTSKISARSSIDVSIPAVVSPLRSRFGSLDLDPRHVSVNEGYTDLDDVSRLLSRSQFQSKSEA